MESLLMQEYEDKLHSLFSGGRRYKYGKSELILRAGDVPPGVYYIEQGFVKVYSLTDKGNENLHVIYRPGEIFPMIWAFKDVVRDVYYESIESSSLLRISKEEFLTGIKKDPEYGFAVSNQIAEQFFVYADRIDNLEYNNAYDRVVYRLLFLSSRFGRRDGDQIVIQAPLTHQHIADSINLARETASRELEQLEHKGLISRTRGNRIVIEDVDRLRAELRDSIDLEPWGVKPTHS
jgi:CRP-like cAMP-binding protein